MISLIGKSVLLLLMLLAGLEAGRWLRRSRADAEAATVDSAAAEGVVYAVLGLLIAFTFTTSAGRFDERRKLIVDQANALGTAWLRVDMLAEADREGVRRPMREWVELYLQEPRGESDGEPGQYQAKLQKLLQLQNEAWHTVVPAVDRLTKAPYANLVLPPFNDWIDLSTTRMEMTHRGLPPMVMSTLLALAFAAAILAGYNMAKRPKRSFLHMLLFAGVITFTIYVIMDLNHPRSGLIRIDAADDAMRLLYSSMTSNMPAR